MPSTYEVITERLITKLEAGVVPWRQPWSHSPEDPLSLVTGRAYRGINWFMLKLSGYGNPYWLSYREATNRGGHVRAGEKGTPIVYWNIREEENEETGKVERVFLARHYTVFNLEQTEGIAAPATTRPGEFHPIEAAQALWSNWEHRPELTHGGSRAYYQSRADRITLPHPESFEWLEHYHATLFHEATHATGHSSRLNRGLDEYLPPFGSPDYSREELIAEMGSAFLCAKAGIDAITLDNQAAYLQSWIGVLKGDSRLLIHAAAAAQRAADYIRNLSSADDGNSAAGES